MLLPSITSTTSSGVRIVMNPEPPIEVKNGSATQAMIAAARHASTPLPPDCATLTAASVPNLFPAAIASLGRGISGG